MTLIAITIVVCVVLAVLGFVVPRLSRGAQGRVDRALTAAQREGSKAPGRMGRLLAKPLGTSRRAADRSAGAGRKARRKLPF